jgi:hypothetical protein
VRLQLEPALGGDLALPPFDLGIHELFHPPAAHADHVVVVPALVELEEGLVAFEVRRSSRPACTNCISTR